MGNKKLRITKVITAVNSILYAQYRIVKLGTITSTSLGYGESWKWKNSLDRNVTLTVSINQFAQSDGYIYTYVCVNTSGNYTYNQELFENPCPEYAYSAATWEVNIPPGYYIVVSNQHNVKCNSFIVSEK